MEKIWLKHYPSGVPAEIDDKQYPSLTHLLEESFRKFADRPAFKCMGKSITYRELDLLSQRVGAWLQSRGLARGATVAIMMPNVLQYPVCIAAILRAGYTVVNVNPLYTPRELEYQLKDSGAQAIFILENFAITLQQVLERTSVQHVVVTSMGDLLGGVKGALVNLVVRKVKKLVPPYHLPRAIKFNQMLAEGKPLSLVPVTTSRDDVAFLQYTGGTTGVSKGATLLHRNVIANLLQVEAWLQPAMKGNTSEALNVVCALPLYHIFALTVCGLMGIRMGSMNILIPNPRDIPDFIKTLSQQPFHILPAVNTLYNALVHHPDFAKLDFSHLRVANGGGMAVQRATAEKWFSITRVPIIEGYGLSETSPVATSNPPTATEYSGTIGLPLPSTEIAIRDDEGKDVPLGQPGEICIRGPQVMAGYWKHPDETAKVMMPDGFFKSGDIGIMDERGHTRIVDRKKDMILVSGFNVYPNEVEGVVAMHPGVLEVAAIGVPDEHSGETVKLFVVKKDPALTEAQLLDYCRQHLTGYKRPKFIEFRTDLPKTNVGKILRRELREKTGS
ncbi:long-chain fatty acid--CoA ligase [Cystobacter ferrugineus]|uniref:Long-chain-fatty-acid--CoA ligase n=1 Tax=Cystobacter ferrugineus TaxID=83449 RepID=A0A1L9B6V8_9BACT|nr:long-chain fatty acid--CoA ligase [Cystobacter ferrugineus]OJH37986.1 long-chain-fatty-acid--CoA ligase [Cystobacter ferrugineus]